MPPDPRGGERHVVHQPDGRGGHCRSASSPTAISNSFGGSEFSTEHNYDSHFTHAGIATTVATGDGGYGTSWPATDPGVTAVGGTELSADTSARGWSETAWSGTESGCSTYEPKPTWQSDTGCANRTIADVSALAGSPYFAIYITYGTSTGWELFGGTSLAAPLIAAVYALAYPIVPTSTSYATTSSLFDVTAGSDGSCGGSYLCTALTGFDGPTGLGTPCGTAAFGTGPFGVADCVAGVTASGSSATSAATPARPDRADLDGADPLVRRRAARPRPLLRGALRTGGLRPAGHARHDETRTPAVSRGVARVARTASRPE